MSEKPQASPDHDPYTMREGAVLPPPTTFAGRLRYLGPSLIVTGAVIGSGELVLTTSLGATVGWTLLWWMLISCWCKSIVQAEIARYTIATGDTYLRAMNRLPGRLGPISWPIWMHLIAYIPITIGLGGIMGGAGESLNFLGEVAGFTIDKTWAMAIIAVGSSILLSTGSYTWLERFMLPLVLTFTVTTLVCSIAMQFTQYHTSSSDLIGGLTPKFGEFGAYAALALAAYGYTGTTSGDITAYTYWCIEKGYPSYLGADRSHPEWEARARGWMKVLHTDVCVALLIVTCATIPYYALGAGVLNQMGIQPEGSEATIKALSNIFTQTLGNWAVWVFSIGAFFILLSTVLSGMGANGRVVPDYLIELRLFDRNDVVTRKRITQTYLFCLPLIALYINIVSPKFVVLIMIGALTSALFLPIQAGATIWLQARHMDPRIRPSRFTYASLWAILVFEIAMAGLVVWYVVLPRVWQT